MLGISGADKTTIGRELESYFQKRGQKCYFLDGDEVLNLFDNNLGYSIVDCEVNIKRIILGAYLLERNDIIGIICNISPFERLRKLVRAKIEGYNEKYLCFMRRLVRDARRKVFFIVNNLKVHHGKLVKAWLEESKDKIEVFFTPTYSPDLNPDEYLNNMLKQSVHSGRLLRTKKDLRKKTNSFMRSLQKRSIE